MKKRPSSPGRAKSGTKTRAMISVDTTIPERTSFEALTITRSGGSGAGFWRFWRKRRMMFSRSTTASSTSSPMAMASPPSVIVLIDSPK
ncbi:MAG: hypothetical protein FAZ92_00318 [Accumulibacter sp.]|nr:MAG: hypothetical protein AW07_01974 [Candidatus Accumulibacter sp. SK-11]TLD47387.1 MAG: hypothetical protein FAZ92_00318 [Accumulibacter sp.]